MQFEQRQSQKFMQHLMMNSQMQQALEIIQAPIAEIEAHIQQELDRNPLLENEVEEEEIELEETEKSNEEELDFEKNDLEILKKLGDEFDDRFLQNETYQIKRCQDEEKKKSYLEQLIYSELTLYEHLIQQAKEYFSEHELHLAESLIGNFDHNGFLTIPLKEIADTESVPISDLKKILNQIQDFDPVGVGAHSLQHSLLLQLEKKGLQKSLGYELIKHDYDELLHNRIPYISKELGYSIDEIKNAVDHQIGCLNFHPGSSFSKQACQTITPDLLIFEEDDELKIEVIDEPVTTLRINRHYLKLLDDPNTTDETKEFVKQKLQSAKWLVKNISQRNSTLYKIAESILHHNKAFFQNPKATLLPLTMQTVADEIELHESTVVRAVSGKYVDTPRGVLPLRYFFSSGLKTKSGSEISSHSVQDLMQEIVSKEDKHNPLSDDEISEKIKEKGINCARRTVAKYRALLKIASARQRKTY